MRPQHSIVTAMRRARLPFIAIMVPHPVHGPGFIAPQWRDVEKVVGIDQNVQPTGIGRVGVVNAAVIVPIKRAQPWQLAFTAGVGLIVVLPRAFAANADPKVCVEAAARRRVPGKLPAHALAKRLEFSVGRPRHGHQ